MTDDTPTIWSLGFDVSSTGAGAVLLNQSGSIVDSWCWQSAPNTLPDHRVWSLWRWARSVLKEIDGDHGDHAVIVKAMETPFFRGASSALLAEVQGAVKAATLLPEQWGQVAPSAVKSIIRSTMIANNSPVTSSKIYSSISARLHWGPAAFHYLERTARAAAETAGGGAKAEEKAIGDICDAAWVAEHDRRLIIRSREEG